jgi:hypothetical protein
MYPLSPYPTSNFSQFDNKLSTYSWGACVNRKIRLFKINEPYIPLSSNILIPLSVQYLIIPRLIFIKSSTFAVFSESIFQITDSIIVKSF